MAYIKEQASMEKLMDARYFGWSDNYPRPNGHG